jgi:hypothetical protein
LGGSLRGLRSSWVAFERIVVPALTRGLYGLRRGGARSTLADDDAQRRLTRHGGLADRGGDRPSRRPRHVLDAGYSVSHVQRYVLAVMEQLSRIETLISAPFLANVSGDSGRAF